MEIILKEDIIGLGFKNEIAYYIYYFIYIV